MKKTITLLLLALGLQVSAQCWQQIASGAYHVAAIKADGSLWSWGLNSSGQLGNNTSSMATTNTTPVQIGGGTNWSKVATGFQHTLAIKTDGTLWAWGANTLGALGNGTIVDSNVPIQIGTDTDWASISAGTSSSAAIKTNGTLWCWGRNLGNGTEAWSTTPVQIGTDTWLSVSKGDAYALAIKTNGSLWAWGYNYYGQLGNSSSGSSDDVLSPVRIGTATWLQVAAGNRHSLGIQSDNSLWSWGYNDKGQIMGGQNTIQTTPSFFATTNATSWKSISAGNFHTLAVTTEGQLWASGSGQLAQIGNGASNDVNGATHIGTATDWLAVDGGMNFSTAIKSDGSLSTWGTNNYGQLGLGHNVLKNSPTAVTCPTSLAVDQFAGTAISIYPNPVVDLLHLAYDQTITAVAFYNVLGQEVFAKPINANAAQVDVSQLHAGTYFVKITAGDQVKTVKIIKE